MAPDALRLRAGLWQRWEDWQLARAKKRDQKELDKRRARKPVVTAKLVPATILGQSLR